MNLKSLLPLSVLLLSATASADEFNGILVQDGAGCVLVELPTGERYIPDDGGAGMPIGSAVHVVGDYDPSCGSICFVNDGCIWNAVTTAGWPFDACGVLIQDFAGCVLIEMPNGDKFIPDDAGAGLPMGSTVHMTGTLDPSCGSICGPNNGCIWGASTTLDCPPPSVGTNYCTTSPNSISPSGSTIGAHGSDSIAAADLTLVADNAPVGMAAVFFYGPSQTQLPFGNGFRCVSGGIQRLPVTFESAGKFESVVDFGVHGTNLSNMGTVNFQCYFRDTSAGGAEFNTSDATQVVFTL